MREVNNHLEHRLVINARIVVCRSISRA